MTKQQVTIEVDVPEGWEIDAVIAQPVKCIAEHVQIAGNKSVEICGGQGSVNINCKRAWQWPSWLKAEWLAMDEYGQWHAYRDEPKELPTCWNFERPRLLLSTWTDFQPPPCTDWQQSKRRRPTS